VLPPVLPNAYAPGADDDLPGHKERSEVSHDVGKRRLPAHQVVLMAAVRRTLVVGVVLVELDPPAPGIVAAAWFAAAAMTRSPALSQITASRGLVTSGVEYSGCACRRRAGRRW